VTTRSLTSCPDAVETGYDRDISKDDSFSIVCKDEEEKRMQKSEKADIEDDDDENSEIQGDEDEFGGRNGEDESGGLNGDRKE
jgi:hypothetical protein